MIIRSLLFTPAHNEKFVDSALNSEADIVTLDLEDAVPQKFKKQAMLNINQVMKSYRGKKRIFVRINSWADLEHLGSHISGVVVPKIEMAEELYAHRASLSNYSVIPLIETPHAIFNLQNIAAFPNNIGLLFGVEDFLQYTYGEWGANQEGLHVPRHLVSMASHFAGIVPIDCPYTDVRNTVGLEEHIKKAKVLGFEGMLTLNLEQTKRANWMYTPAEHEFSEAKEMIEAYKECEKEGRSIAIVNNRFVSPPTLKKALRIVERYNSIAMLNTLGEL